MILRHDAVPLFCTEAQAFQEYVIKPGNLILSLLLLKVNLLVGLNQAMVTKTKALLEDFWVMQG